MKLTKRSGCCRRKTEGANGRSICRTGMVRATSSDEERYNIADSRPVVYRIRAFTPSGEPQQIPRCNGVDAEGILHIGESQKLQTRVLFFLQAVANGRAAHSAGCEFYESGFGERFPLNCLRWDFATAGSKVEAVELELRLQRRYRRVFLDKPPLDGSIGKNLKHT